MEVKSVGVKVNFTSAEALRKWLLTHDAINISLSFVKNEDGLIIPLVLSSNEAQNLLSSFPEKIECSINEFLFPEKILLPKNLFEAIANSLPENLHDFIPKAYDIIGDIAIIEIPDELELYKSEIGNALFSVFPAIKTVYHKASAVSGDLRIRELEYLSGEEKCETVHTEHSIRILVDVCKTYFSPRLSNEHNLVSSKIHDGDIIIDFFTGVGSFPLHIARNCKATIFAIDINEAAIKCLKKSINLNKLKGEIIPITGDCRKVSISLPKADGIIMNLPGKSLEYLSVACELIKSGGIIYFYYFSKDKSPKETMLKILDKELEKLGYKIKHAINYRKIRESAPYEIQACLEFSLDVSKT